MFVSSHYRKVEAPSGIITDGLVERWPCQEGTGTLVSNSASSNDGTFSPSMDNSNWQAGRLGSDYSIYFNSSEHEVATGDVDGSVYIGAISLCCWAYLLPGVFYHQFLFHSTSANGGTRTPFSLLTNNTNRITFIRANASTFSQAASIEALPTSVFVHIGVSAADGAMDTTIKFYINGSLQTTDISGQNPGTPLSGNVPIRIGCRPDKIARIRGNIQDVRIYDRVLSDSEFAQIAAGNG